MAQVVAPLPNGRQQFLNSSGQPLVGGSVATYVPNTLTPKTTWSDSAGTVANVNPLTLDSMGSASLWGSGYYRQIVKDSLGNTIWDSSVLAPGSFEGAYSIDTVASFQTTAIAAPVTTVYLNGYYTAGDGGAGTYTRSGSAGPGPGLVQSSDGQWWILSSTNGVNARQTGAKGDGTTDDTTAVQNALTLAGNNNIVFIPAGSYLLSATLNGYNNQSVIGAGPNSTSFIRNTVYGDTLHFSNIGAGTVRGIWFKHSVIPTNTSTPLAALASDGSAHVNIVAGQGFTVEFCWFWRLPYGVRVNGSANFAVMNNNFTGVWDPQIVADQEGISNIIIGDASYCQIGKIVNNLIGGTPSATRSTTWTASDGTYTGSIANNCGSKYGIEINHLEVVSIYGNYMGGNSINNILIQIGLNQLGVELSITGNDFDGAGPNNACIQVVTSDNSVTVNGLEISNNTFNGEQFAFQAIMITNSSGAGTPNPAAANVAICNNTIQALVGSGIMLYNVRGATISNNSITSYNSYNTSKGADLTFVSGIWASNNSTAINAVGNTLGGGINTAAPTSYCYQGVVGSYITQKNTFWNGAGSTGSFVGKIDDNVVHIGNSNYNLTGNEDVVFVSNSSATIQIFPPSNVPIGYRVQIKDQTGTAATYPIAFIGTVDGATNYTINTNYGKVTVMFNGTNYSILGT